MSITSHSTRLNEDVRAAVLVAEQPEEGPNISHCLVCYSNDLTRFTAKTPCQHDEICAVCHLRLRHLHNDKKCPICKAENAQLIVDSATTENNLKKFSEYHQWGDSLGSDFLYRDDVGMFFPTLYYQEEIRPLFGFHCTLPDCDYNGTESSPGAVVSSTTTSTTGTSTTASSNASIRSLQDHLRVKHRLALCNLCTEYKRDFVSRLPRFTPTQLKVHLQSGDGAASGFEGHPLCQFCRPKRFYDLTQLHTHLQKDHYKCHVCEKQGLDNQYYSDYPSLERHFDKQHYLCKDVQCLQARFVVFDNELDWRHHERQVHGISGTLSASTKIQLEFKVRGSASHQEENHQTVPDENDFNFGLGGEAFVPSALPAGRGDIALHPLHVQRTAQLRLLAAELRQTNNIDTQAQLQADAFPSLQASSEEQSQQQSQFRVGWTSEGGTNLAKRVGQQKRAGAVTDEDFPSLPTAPKPKPAMRQFAAMNLSAGTGNRIKTSSSTAAASWAGTGTGGGGYSTSAAISTAATESTSFLTLSGSGPKRINTNNTSNLTSDNFPSLGPPPKKASQQRQTQQLRGHRQQHQHQPQPYTAAESLAKKLQNNNNNFPSLDAGSAQPYASKKPATSSVPESKVAPSLSSAEDFPAPPLPSAALLQHQQPQQHLPLQAPSASSVATVDDIKAKLGPAKYKQFKSAVKQFVSGALAPYDFVDTAAALFYKGFEDADFWNFVPALVETCPNASSAQQAMRYMESIRNKNKNSKLKMNTTNYDGASSIGSSSVPPGFSSLAAMTATSSSGTGQWTSVSDSRVASPPPVVSAPAMTGMRYVPPPTTTILSRPMTNSNNTTTTVAAVTAIPGMNNKSAAAWGSGGPSSSVVRAKAPPGSVAIAAAAAAAQPHAGSATKYMAKQSKQESAAAASAGGKKKKNKQSNELRNLAFGS